MKVIILAGGQGTRLPISAKGIPKPLIKINNKTLLDYQINLLERNGFSDIRLSLGYMADQIIDHMKENYPGKYEWVIEKEKLGTGGGIKFASRDLNEDFLALNVDDFPKINFNDFVKFHEGHDIENTIAIYEVEDARDFGLVEHANGLIKDFLEKPKTKRSGHINTGFYILNPGIFQAFPDKYFSIERDVFPVLAKNKKLACYQNISHWFTTGTEERLKQAKKFLKNIFD
ncbi:hypothetical protein D4R86_03295 [bacterium]|nr:MAG: hypothetical protein D4R86_03295 [bacterium]